MEMHGIVSVLKDIKTLRTEFPDVRSTHWLHRGGVLSDPESAQGSSERGLCGVVVQKVDLRLDRHECNPNPATSRI